MNAGRFSGFVVLLTLIVASLAIPRGSAFGAARGPNVVVILLDNCGQEWFGCFGSEERCTPNIDRLASEGVRFENCYTPPVCGPSRMVLLTGRYLLRSGFTLHHDAALYSGGGFDPAREFVFARAFRDAGYATGLVGKWQINNLYDEPDVLNRHGFDEHLAWPGSIDATRISRDEYERYLAAVRAFSVEGTVKFMPFIESRYWDPVLIRNGTRESHAGRFGPDVMQSAALDFIRRHRDKPFLLYYPMVLTHGKSFTEPVVPTPLNADVNRPHHEMYADMLRYADRLIGEVAQTLDELDLREKTLLVVASDNGTEKETKARRNGRIVAGGLYELNEAGGNVALIANSPGLIPGGRTIPLADFSDVFPTLCEFTGVPVPKNVLLDGRSHAAVLRNQPGAKPAREWIFNQYGGTRCVRDTRYKLYSTGKFFDVQHDPQEVTDLAASSAPEHAAARERLAAVLAAMPADAPPPFPLRSQSAFKLHAKKP
jgi:arylsulfatase A